MGNILSIRLYAVAKCNHKAVGVERFRRPLNYLTTCIGSARQNNKCFVEAAMNSNCAWNSVRVDGMDSIRSISAIDCPL